jgi:hypothetical protein
MIISKRNLDKVLKGVIAALPEVPNLMRSRSRTPTAYYVLGGVGLTIVGGLVALMILDPAVRTRAAGGAKDVYERLNVVASNDVTAAPPLTNGLANAGQASDDSEALSAL